MTNIETVEITKEEVLDRKMEEYVHRREHINFQKKECLFCTRRYWKKKYNKRGRNCHKKEDIIKRKDREYKNTDKDEQIFFIFINETTKQKLIKIFTINTKQQNTLTHFSKNVTNIKKTIYSFFSFFL